MESFISIVEQVKPKAFLMENVTDIAQTGEQEIYRSIINRAEKAGYRINPKLIYAWQYGVPQLRPRLFISNKINECAPMKWPKPKYDSVEDAVTLDEAISDLLHSQEDGMKSGMRNLAMKDQKRLSEINEGLVRYW